MSAAQPPRGLVDCAIIGGGPAGLLAATYLARFRRHVCLISDGPSRAEWIPRTRNIPAYPDGLIGRDLLGRLRRQARRLGVRAVPARIARLTRSPEGHLLLHRHGDDPSQPLLRAGRVILATGVQDRIPSCLHGQWEAVRGAIAHLCPVCDAYEHRNAAVLVLGSGEHATLDALFLRTYTPKLTLLTDGSPAPGGDLGERLRAAGVTVCAEPIAHIGGSQRDVVVTCRAGTTLRAQALYVAMGVHVRSELAVELGARCDAQGYLICDAHQQTSVPGLYAAGDVVQSLSQISVAFGQAAIAASAVHQSLDPCRLQAPPQRSWALPHQPAAGDDHQDPEAA